MTIGSGETTVLQQLGEYRLVEELGEGTLFRVFKARHVKLHRDVVIKFMRENNADDCQALARFRREMEAVGGVEHPNVVWATDAGDHNGTPFIVMEYLAGQTLQDVIAANGPLSVPDACELARQAALGLECIHNRGMVHRDVKPSNLLLTVGGVVKLLDFGLVRLSEFSGGNEELTAAATALGTPDYIAPEQASDSRRVDCRSDIYSLGCTLYELLTGAPPFAGSGYDTTVKKLLAHTQTPAPSVRTSRGDVPLELSNLLDRMLAKAPNVRPSSVVVVIAALTPFCMGNQLLGLLKGSERTPGVPRAPLPTVSKIGLLSDPTMPPGLSSPNRWRTVALITLVIAVPIAGIVLWRVWERPVRLAKGEAAKNEIVKDSATREQLSPADDPPAATGVDSLTPTTVGLPQSEFSVLREAVAATAGKSSLTDHAKLRERLLEFTRKDLGTSEKVAAAGLLSQLLWPADTLKHESISQEEFDSSGKQQGQPPAELVAVFGTSRLKHWQSVRSIAFSPDGTLLATPGLDGVIRIWDTKAGEPRARLQSNTGSYEAVSFTADGSALVGVGTNGWFHVWDVATWEMRPPIEGQGGRLAGRWETAWTVFSPDARLLIAAGKDNTVLIYDSMSGKVKDTFHGHSSAIKCVGFSDDGQTAASGDDAGTAIVWDVSSGNLRKKIDPGHGPVCAVSLNPDGKLLAAGHADGWIALAHLDIDEPPRMITAAGNVGALAFSPNGQKLLAGSGGSGSGLREIDVESGKIVRTLEFYSTFCQFPRYSPDGSAIACGHWEGEIGLWDAATGTSRFESPSHDTALWSVAAAPNGTQLAAGGHDGIVVVWNVETGGLVRKTNFNCSPKTLAFVSDPNRLFFTLRSGNGVRTFGFWDISNGSRESKVQVAGDSWWLTGPILDLDGSFVVSADEKHAISVWELSGRERLILRNHTAEVDALAVSPDGSVIASAGRDERVRIWDARSGVELRTLITTAAQGKSLAFSPDGKTLACGTSETNIRLWNVATGNALAVLVGHASNRFGVLGLAFNPGGTLLASCSGDGTICIWDAETHQQRQTIAVGPRGGIIKAVSFLPDGRHLATANQNGTVYLLRLESR